MEMEKQGKRTADHILPLGDWLLLHPLSARRDMEGGGLALLSSAPFYRLRISSKNPAPKVSSLHPSESSSLSLSPAVCLSVKLFFYS